MQSRRANFEKQMLIFLEKYDDENKVQRKTYRAEYSETGTFENLKIFVKDFEVSKFYEDDKDFVSDLSKCIKH